MKSNNLFKYSKISGKGKNLLKTQNIDVYSIEYSLLFKKATNIYFLCPYCQKKVPLIFPLIDSSNVKILLYLICECGEQRIITLKEFFSVNTDNQINKEFKEYEVNCCDICLSNTDKNNLLYCLKFNAWMCKNCREISFQNEEKNHSFAKYNINFKKLCKIHSIYYNLYYCFTCKKDICVKCTKNEHKLHEYISVENFFQKINNKFKDFCLKYKKLYDIRRMYSNKTININKNYINILNYESKELENEYCNEFFYDLIENKIKSNIGKITREFNKYFDNDNDMNITSDDINEINDYIIIYYRLNIQLLYLIKFTYERFLFLENYKNINIIINMNILSNLNLEEFKFAKMAKKSSNNKKEYKNGEINQLEIFKRKLKNYVFFSPIINIEGLINFQSYNNFVLTKKSKVKNIVNLNDNDYLILTDISLLYYNTNRNTMHNISPKLINQKINFGISVQYIKKDSNVCVNCVNSDSDIQNDTFNISIKEVESLDDSTILNDFQKTKKYTKKMSSNFDIIMSDYDNYTTLPSHNKFFCKKNSAMINFYPTYNPIINYDYNLIQNISSICKYTDNFILIAYKNNIIKCLFSKINNELLSVNIFNYFTAHKKPIYLLNILKNGYLITASEDNTFKIWDIASYKINNTKIKCLYSINKKIFTLYEKIIENKTEDNKINNNCIFFGNKNGFFICEDYKWNNLKNVINHKDRVTSLLINKNNEVITGSLDRYIKKTNIVTLEENKKIIMENSIISFIAINDNFFGAMIEDFGFYIIDAVKLCRIQYIQKTNNKIKGFGNLGDGCFYCIIDKEKESIINDNNENEINNLNYNMIIRIVKGYFGNNGSFVAFS